MGDDLAFDDRLPVLFDDRFLEQRQVAVQFARVVQSLGNRFGAEEPGRLNREPVQIDVVTFGTMHVLPVYQVVVSGEDALGYGVGIDLPGTLTHDGQRGQVIAVPIPEQVADFVHRHVEPITAVLAGPPVFGVIHDGDSGQTARGYADHIAGAGRRANHRRIARDDRHPLVSRFHELNAEIIPVHLENLTGPILLGLRDHVFVAGNVFPLEVVIGRADTVEIVSGRRVVGQVVVVHVDVKNFAGEVAMSRLVGRARPFQAVWLRLDSRRENDALQRRSETQPVQVLVGRRVARTRVVAHRNRRSIDLLILVANAQPEAADPRRVQLVQRTLEVQIGLVFQGIVNNVDRVEYQIVRRIGRLLGRDQLIEIRLSGGLDVQFIIVEIDFDLVERLNQVSARVTAYRLRNRGNHLGPKIQGEIDPHVAAFVERHREDIHQRIGTRTHDGNPVGIIRQRLGKSDNHFVSTLANPDPTVGDRHIVAVAKSAVAAAADDLDRAERVAIDDLTVVETEQQFPGCDMIDFPVLKQFALVGYDGYQLQVGLLPCAHAGRQPESNDVERVFKSRKALIGYVDIVAEIHIDIVCVAEDAVLADADRVSQVAALVHQVCLGIILIRMPVAEEVPRLVHHDIADPRADQIDDSNRRIEPVLIQRVGIGGRCAQQIQQHDGCLFRFEVTHVDRFGKPDRLDSELAYRPADHHAADVGHPEHVAVIARVENLDVELTRRPAGRVVAIVAEKTYVAGKALFNRGHNCVDNRVQVGHRVEPPAGQESRQRRERRRAGGAENRHIQTRTVEIQQQDLAAADGLGFQLGTEHAQVQVVVADAAHRTNIVSPRRIHHPRKGRIAAAGQRRNGRVSARDVLGRADQLEPGGVLQRKHPAAQQIRPKNVTRVQIHPEEVDVSVVQADRHFVITGRVGSPARGRIRRVRLPTKAPTTDNRVVVVCRRRSKHQIAIVGKPIVIVDGQQVSGRIIDPHDGIQCAAHRLRIDVDGNQITGADSLNNVPVVVAAGRTEGPVADVCCGQHGVAAGHAGHGGVEQGTVFFRRSNCRRRRTGRQRAHYVNLGILSRIKAQRNGIGQHARIVRLGLVRRDQLDDRSQWSQRSRCNCLGAVNHLMRQLGKRHIRGQVGGLYHARVDVGEFLVQPVMADAQQHPIFELLQTQIAVAKGPLPFKSLLNCPLRSFLAREKPQ